MRKQRITAVIAACSMLFAGLALPSSAQADDSRPVDVFIGDSSAVQGAYSDGTTADQRWTRLFSDADGADEVNVAVGGTGFVVGAPNTFKQQVDKAIKATQGRTVRRVFVVGIGNDMSAQAAGRITSGQITRALIGTMPKVAAAWPGAQKLYVPEASPMTGRMQGAYQRMSPYMPDIYRGVGLVGFTSMERWDTLVDGNGTSKDGTHLNRKGNNLMAHAMQKWVNTLDGPKNTGTIPAWKDPDPMPKTYTVSFDGAQGSKTDPVKAEAGEPVSKPKDPTRDGYTFQGWTLDGKPYDFATPVSKDITLTAVWSKKDEPKPTSREADVFIGDSSMAGIAAAQRWTTLLAAKDNATPIDVSASGAGFIAGDTFDKQQDQAIKRLRDKGLDPARDVKRVFVDGGINDLSILQKDPSKIATYADTVTATLTRIKNAYPEAQLLYSPSVGVQNPTTEETVKQTDPYLSQLNQGAAKLGYRVKDPWPFMAGPDPDYKLVYSKANMHMNKDGHKQAAERIVAWIDTLDGPKVGETAGTPGTKPTTFTVTFDTGDGSKIDPVKVEDGKPVAKPQDPTRAGYEFKGWRLGGKAYDFTTPVTKDITITAAWDAIPAEQATVTFTGDGVTIPAQRLDVGGTATKPQDPVRDGYTFTGWALDGKPYDFKTPVTKDITLTATWRRNETAREFTVSFDTGAGASRLDPVKVKEGEPVAKPKDPTRAGYCFDGWTLDGKPYDFKTPITADTTLTAKWTSTGTNGGKPGTGTNIIETIINRIDHFFKWLVHIIR